MKMLTGNDLKTGDVIGWAGDTRWSRHLADSVDAGDQAEAILKREEAALRVNVFGFAVAEFDYVRPLDRSRRGWLWQFGLTPGF